MVAAAALQRSAIAAMMGVVARIIAPLYIILSLPCVEQKRHNPPGMKYWEIRLAIFAALSASLALAEDFKTIDGKEYKNVTVKRVEPDGLVLGSKSGISKVYFTELPKDVQQRFNYDPDKAAAYSAEQNAALEQGRKQQEEAMRRKNDLVQRNNEQLGKEQASIEWNTKQRENVRRLRARYNELQKQDDDLVGRIQEAERLPSYLSGQSGSKHYSYRNPARQYIPDWQKDLNDVRHEKDEVRKQLEQAQR